MNTELIKALNSETKTLKRDTDNKVERDFIRTYWYIFAGDKGFVTEALKTAPEGNGQDILDLLGLNSVHVEKVKLTELLSFCYHPNKLFTKFVNSLVKDKVSTYFFTAGKTSIVVTNKLVLKPDKIFTHKIELKSSPDIYWATVDSVKNDLKVY